MPTLQALPYTWYAAWSRHEQQWYATGQTTRRSDSDQYPAKRLDRLVLGEVKETQFVRHINGNLLDCTRSNLRITTIQDRFMEKVTRDGECWRWTGSLSDKGYGRFMVGGKRGKSRPAHRVSYELFVGPILSGLHLDHLCRNRWCVNPAHLEPVTPVENILRGEGVTAHNARATHCKHGHPFDEKNTYARPGGGRKCRTCLAEAARRWVASVNYPANLGSAFIEHDPNCVRFLCACGKSHTWSEVTDRQGDRWERKCECGLTHWTIRKNYRGNRKRRRRSNGGNTLSTSADLIPSTPLQEGRPQE